MMASLSGTLSTMCPGIPYALAAKINNPERVVISLVGDGAVQMLGLNGLITIAKYWREWCDPRLVIMVLNNEDLNQVTWEQRVMNGDPKFMGSQDIPAFPYARYAQMLGLEGIELRHPNEIGAAWDAALKAGKPVVIDAHCDPEVPPLPPHITFEQAKGYMFSIFKGDPNLWNGQAVGEADDGQYAVPQRKINTGIVAVALGLNCWILPSEGLDAATREERGIRQDHPQSRRIGSRPALSVGGGGPFRYGKSRSLCH
ncbi:thiamine pyrophosphate-dependent enzyme [Geotalea toluenoxydans]|uniref:thiamine pyrophosphate-dependent enzyme n=1 Tax=Geotalea toluenoxydans TaxID=421624 RepID=UPI001FB24780|nr:thiamine pyrophosphate-dependent enzyme [Geotalea toluenoxydans]